MAMARVQPRGQVTIPREVRRACDITPGTDLFFTATGPGSFECRALPRHSLLELAERYAAEGTAPDLNRLREEMADDLAREHIPVQPSTER